MGIYHKILGSFAPSWDFHRIFFAKYLVKILGFLKSFMIILVEPWDFFAVEKLGKNT